MKRVVAIAWIAGLAGMTPGHAADLKPPALTPQRQPAVAVMSSWPGPISGRRRVIFPAAA